MRREFPAKVKLAVYERCLRNGKPHCEECSKLILGVPEYDHRTPDGLGGEPTIENCQALCGTCHRIKTHEHDRPIMAKADMQRKKSAGIKRNGPVIPGSRNSRFKRKINGEVVTR